VSESWETVDVPTHPIPDGRWVAIRVHIRETATGTVATYLDKTGIEEGEKHPNPFWWSEGNASCDCNRELFFNRALGRPEIETACSSGRFLVRLENKVDGTPYYSEFP
jgi:hypothetical protein